MEYQSQCSSGNASNIGTNTTYFCIYRVKITPESI